MKDIAFRKERVFSGLGLLALAVALGFLLENFTGPDSKMWQRLVFICAVMGTGLSGLLCTFMGWLGVLFGYGGVLLIGLIRVLPEILPEPWNRYYVFLYLLLLFAYPAIKKKRAKKAKKKDAPKPEQKESKEAPCLKSQDVLIVHGLIGGNYYQLIRTTGEIRAYFLGGELTGVKEELMQDPNKPPRAPGKKDLSIQIDSIQSVEIKEYPENSVYEYALIIKAGRKYRFCPITNGEIEKYAAFFKSWIKKNNGVKKSDLNKKRLEMVRKIHTGYCAYILLVSLCWLFLEVPYKLFSALTMIGLPGLLALYVALPDYYTIFEKTRSTPNISITLPAFGASIAVSLRTLMDFNILQWGRLLAMCGIAFVVCMVVLMLLTKEWKYKKTALLYFAFILIFYLPGALGQINCAFDTHIPQVCAAEVTELSISTSSKGPDRYNVDVLLEDGTDLSLETNQEHYETLSVGDDVEVLFLDGVLGVSHGYLN